MGYRLEILSEQSKLSLPRTHMRVSRGLCDWGWCPYIGMLDQKKIESNFSNRLTFQTFAIELLIESRNAFLFEYIKDFLT